MELHVTPAYGRDYKSKSAALADWQAGKDFRDSQTGQYLSIRDAQKHALQIWIHYNKLRKIIRA